MRTILLPPQSRQRVVLDLLKNQETIGDTAFVSLSVFLNTLVKTENDRDWYRVVKELQELSSKNLVSSINPVMCYPITADQCLRFGLRMVEEGWNVDDLPQRSVKEKELSVLIKSLDSIFEPYRAQWLAFKTVQDGVIYPHFYSYGIHQRLKTSDFKLIALDHHEKVSRQVRFANTTRLEVEGALQYILQDAMSLDDQMIVCVDSSLLDVVEQFCERYALEYQRVVGGKRHPIFRFFEDLLKFSLNPSLDGFINIVHNDGLHISHKWELLTYLEKFKPSLEAILNPLHGIKDAFENELLGNLVRKDNFIVLEEKAEIALSQLRGSLVDLMGLDSSIQLRLEGCFKVLVERVNSQDDVTQQALYTLKESLENLDLDLVSSLDDPWESISYQLSHLSLQTKTKTGLLITDLNHAMVPGLKRQIWLGCTQAYYPNVSVATGLFDESFLLGIKGYDASARYAYHMDTLEGMQKSCPEIIYSYALGSYEGKAQRMPYELENSLVDIPKQAWVIYEEPIQSIPTVDHLNPALSQALYFKPHLKGSITSFERYFECPYHYYLNRGLNLWPEESYEINSAIMGNAIHLLLEKAVLHSKQAYPTYLEMHLDEQVEPLITALKQLFKTQGDVLDLLAYKLKETLKLSLEYLKDWESKKDYKPVLVEHEFSKTMTLNEGTLLELRGVIDRIDQYLDKALVIDYKSSPKTFSEARFMQGVQLQLMTYIWALPEELKASAALYFSHKALKYDLKNTEEDDVSRLKNRRVKGILFEGDKSMDQDGTHITSFTLKEDETVSVSPQYDRDKMIKHLVHLYTTLAIELKEGVITKQNKNNSCLHCDYAHFCQFKGFPIKMKRITKDESVLRHVV